MSSKSLSFPSATALSPAVTTMKPGMPVLDVLSGMNLGVRAPIEDDACTIGSSSGCDLVLSDGNVAREHLRLRFYGREAAVDAIGGDVAIEGRPVLQRGLGCRVRLPATLVVGDARLKIGRHAADHSPVRRWAPYALVAALIAMMPIVAVQANIGGISQEPALSPEDRLTVGSLPAQSAVPTDAEIVAALQQKITEAGLGDLAVSADGRRIDVSGSVAPQRMEAWRDVQRWFDRSHGGRYVLTSLVAAAAVTEAPKFVFQAVYFGSNPYVVDARGERRYPGAALQDGWLLKSIENGQILVVRGGQEFKLTL